jgi:hypothetical protein
MALDQRKFVVQGGEDGIQLARSEESQPRTASDRTRTLTDLLMERICERDELNQAYRKVKANRGAPGTDGLWPAALLQERNDFATISLSFPARNLLTQRRDYQRSSGGAELIPSVFIL